jgi:DsbC/DsbD-like thiol-disulfide interchange protein
MKRVARLWGLCWLLAAGPVGAEPPQAVHAQLVADVAGVAAGKSFRLGVLFHIEPGWHIYWKDPGDAGMATSIAFGVPRGFRAGELLWPVPKSWVLPGDIHNNGYEDAVLLAAPVEAPAGLASGAKAPVDAEVRWLACKEVCVPGRARLTLELPVVETPAPANQELFAAWEKSLPAKGTEK